MLESLAADLYGLGYYDLAASGALVFVPPAEQPLDEIVWVDRSQLPEVIATHRQNIVMPAISPDGSRVSMTLVSDTQAMTLWLLDPERGTMVRLVTGGQNSHSAVWTPDGSAVAFTSDHEGPSNLYLKSVTSGAPLTRLTRSEQHHDAASFSPDGRYLTFSELHPDTNWDVWVLDTETRNRTPFLQSEAEEMQGIVSPAGGLLAYTSNETGRREIYLEKFPGGGDKQRVSVDGGEDSVWSRGRAHVVFSLAVARVRDADRLAIRAEHRHSGGGPRGDVRRPSRVRRRKLGRAPGWSVRADEQADGGAGAAHQHHPRVARHAEPLTQGRTAFVADYPRPVRSMIALKSMSAGNAP